MGYILQIPNYNHNWKIEKSPLRLYPSKKTTLLFQPYKKKVYMTALKKEKRIFNEIIVSAETYFRLTGKGRDINELI